MYRYLLPAIVVLFWGSHLQAQQFAGKGSLTLESQGNQSSTLLSSQQVAGKFDASKQEIHFYFKTLSLGVKENEATREMVSNFFLSDAFPVVDLKIDQVSKEDLNKGQVRGNAALTLLGQSFVFPLSITSSSEGEGFNLSTEFSIDLSSKQIQLPSSYTDRMGQKITFTIDQFILNRR